MFLQFLFLLQISLLLLASSSSAASFMQTKAGCQAKCGNITIPYPFGIGGNGKGCSMDGVGYGYSIRCDTSYYPPKPFIGVGNTEILGISETEIRIKYLPTTLCYNEFGELSSDGSMSDIDMSRTQFTFSATKNRFFGVGCNMIAMIRAHDINYKSHCISVCSTRNSVIDGSCSGSGCCQITIPKGITNYLALVGPSKNNSQTWTFDPCNYAFLADHEYYMFKSSDLLERTDFSNIRRDIPVVLDWAIGNKSCDEAQKDLVTYACQKNSYCTNSDNNPGYRCTCHEGYEGNPYLSPGCQDTNECEDVNNNPCEGICTNIKGSYKCSCPEGSSGDGRKDGSGCTGKNETFPVKTVALGAGLGSLFIVLGGSLLFLGLRKRKQMKLKEKFFQKNGGLLLKQQISSKEGGVESIKIFTSKELELATKNYDDSQIIGRGGHGLVYKEVLSENRTVAVKKSKEVDERQIKEFINELVILSQINHRNVVKLLGCCLETDVPLLVYEYISNGTLSDHIHCKDGRFSSISWESRLKIATETAGAVAYLHSVTSVPIIHRDIKSANILLDENFIAKVSDFGASRLVPLDQTHATTLNQGTFGYFDPECLETGKPMTEKSDTYSFGVVLVELLTGEKPIFLKISLEVVNVVSNFISLMEENDVFQIVEPQVANEGNREQIFEVAKLAKRCLNMKAEDRPTMTQVVDELEGIRKSKTDPSGPDDHQQSHEEIRSISANDPKDLYDVPFSSYATIDSR